MAVSTIKNAALHLFSRKRAFPDFMGIMRHRLDSRVVQFGCHFLLASNDITGASPT
jgi:hypothetical protein